MPIIPNTMKPPPSSANKAFNPNHWRRMAHVKGDTSLLLCVSPSFSCFSVTYMLSQPLKSTKKKNVCVLPILNEIRSNQLFLAFLSMSDCLQEEVCLIWASAWKRGSIYLQSSGQKAQCNRYMSTYFFIIITGFCFPFRAMLCNFFSLK